MQKEIQQRKRFHRPSGSLFFLHVCLCSPAQHMCTRAVTSSLCDRTDRQGRPGGLHAVSATFYLALRPHNLPLVCASLKASNTWASALKCCRHIIENHPTFYRIKAFKVLQCLYEDVCERVFIVSHLGGIGFVPYAVPTLNRPHYLPIPLLCLSLLSFPTGRPVPSNGFRRSSRARHSYPWAKLNRTKSHEVPSKERPLNTGSTSAMFLVL